MIDKNVILSQIGGRAALWCAADMDAGDLAQAVGVLDVQGLNMMSVAPGAVATVWPWLEKKINLNSYLKPTAGENIMCIL